MVVASQFTLYLPLLSELTISMLMLFWFSLECQQQNSTNVCRDKKQERNVYSPGVSRLPLRSTVGQVTAIIDLWDFLSPYPTPWNLISYMYGISSYMHGISFYMYGISSYMYGISFYILWHIILHTMAYQLVCLPVKSLNFLWRNNWRNIKNLPKKKVWVQC